MRVGRPKHKLVGLHLYTLHNQNLSETDSAKYLRLTITSDLQWNQHINQQSKQYSWPSAQKPQNSLSDH